MRRTRRAAWTSCRATCGRAGRRLGEPDGLVVAAVFGVFEPGLIAQLYDAARASCGLADIRAAREAGVIAALRAALGSTEAAAAVAGRLRDAAGTASLAGHPPVAGVAGLPWPEDPLARLWQACAMLRELRRNIHLAACAAAGLSGLEANLLTELQVGWPPQSYTATRGWPPEAMDLATARLRDRGLLADTALTGAGASLRADLEAATDRQLEPVIDALGPGLKELLPQLAGWPEQIIERGCVPADPYKRASG